MDIFGRRVGGVDYLTPSWWRLDRRGAVQVGPCATRGELREQAAALRAPRRARVVILQTCAAGESILCAGSRKRDAVALAASYGAHVHQEESEGLDRRRRWRYYVCNDHRCAEGPQAR